MKMKPCFAMKLRKVCFIAAAVFLITVAIDLSLSVSAVSKVLSRGIQINLGFQALYLPTLVPFVFGVLTETKELLIPFLICCAHSFVLNVVWLLFICTEVFDLDLFIFGTFKIPLLLVFILNLFVHAFFVFIVLCYWKELSEHDRISQSVKEKVQKSYALKRFGNCLRSTIIFFLITVRIGFVIIINIFFQN